MSHSIVTCVVARSRIIGIMWPISLLSHSIVWPFSDQSLIIVLTRAKFIRSHFWALMSTAQTIRYFPLRSSFISQTISWIIVAGSWIIWVLNYLSFLPYGILRAFSNRSFIVILSGSKVIWVNLWSQMISIRVVREFPLGCFFMNQAIILVVLSWCWIIGVTWTISSLT
jgi:hypothetical protein